MEVEETDGIEAVKEQIQEQEGIAVPAQQIVFATWTSRKGWTTRRSKSDASMVSKYRGTHEEGTITLKYLPQEGDDPDWRVPIFPKRTATRVLYVLDVSQRMTDLVQTPNGPAQTRWDYLLPLFRNHLEELPDEALFNIVYYSDDTYEAFSQVKEASQDNIDIAIAELEDVLPGGKANVRKALKYAMQQYTQDVYEMHLVMAGEPSSEPEKIIDKVVELNLDHFIPIHTIAFMPFGVHFTAERFLMQLSRANSGCFRCPNLKMITKTKK